MKEALFTSLIGVRRGGGKLLSRDKLRVASRRKLPSHRWQVVEDIGALIGAVGGLGMEREEDTGSCRRGFIIS